MKEVFDREVMPACDHRAQDTLENPTAENLIAWMWKKLQPALPGLRELRVWENPDYCVAFRGA